MGKDPAPFPKSEEYQKIQGVAWELLESERD